MQRKHEETTPVFRLKPVYDQNICEVKLVGYKEPSQKLGDEVIDIDTPEQVQLLHGKNVDLISHIDSYNVTGCIYKNNIVGDYIFKNDFLPVYSISIAYSKTLVDGFLFDIFIGFKLSEESKKLLEDPKKVPNARIYGEYILKLYCDDEVIENFDKVLQLVENATVSEPEVLSKMDTMSEDEFMNYLGGEVEKRKQVFIDLKDGKLLPALTSVNKTATFLRNLYKNNNLNPLFKVALDIRQEERRKKYNAVEKYDIPTKVLNIKDVESDPTMLDKYLGIEQ
jgi:hypothetical protein